MALPLSKEPPPLRTDEHGVVRVGEGRITLDQVVSAFLEGATVEEITTRYDTLDLVDVYATIAYYLRHKDEVDSYLVREAADPRPNEGLVDWLLACPEKGFFVPVESESTDEL